MKGNFLISDNLKCKVVKFIINYKKWNLGKFERAVGNQLAGKILYVYIIVYDIDDVMCWGLIWDRVFFLLKR